MQLFLLGGLVDVKIEKEDSDQALSKVKPARQRSNTIVPTISKGSSKKFALISQNQSAKNRKNEKLEVEKSPEKK